MHTAGTNATRGRVKQFDEESKKIINDHLSQQKVTQKLGLDYHIFEEESKWQRKTRVQTTKNSEAVSPTKTGRKDMGGPFGINQSEVGIIASLDAYKARKEPIPFGMSEKIWDLDSYKQNFERFEKEFGKIKRKYEQDEERLRELRGEINPSHNESTMNKKFL